MWYLFGILASLKIAGVFTFWRFLTPWSGKTVSVGDDTCEVRESKRKGGRVIEVRVGVPCAADFYFTVRRESRLDRWFKRLGLATEQTVNDSVFDDALYLLSDDQRFGALLRNSPKLRDALHSLLHDFESKWLHVDLVRCGRGRLWVDCSPGTLLGNDLTGELAARRLLPVLTRAARALEEPVHEASAKGARDRSVLIAGILLAISSALAIHGLVQAFLTAVGTFPSMVDGEGLRMLSYFTGALLACALLALCFWSLRKSARAHVVALEILVTGTVGAIGTSYALLHELNQLDRGDEPRVVEARITRYESYACGKKNRDTCYALGVAETEQLGPMSWSIGSGLYRRFAGARAARLSVHDGKLGYRYIERIDPVF